MQLARQVGGSSRICYLLEQLSWIAIWQGRHEDALELAHEGLELARRQADEESMVRLLNRLAHAMWARGDTAQAEALMREALALARHLGYRELQASLSNEESLRLARQAQAIGQLSGEVLAPWGDVCLHFQRLEEAEAAYQELLPLQASGELDVQTKARARYGLARVAGQRGQMSVARRLGQESRAAYEALGHHQRAAEVTQWMHTLSSLEGDAPPTTAENAPGLDLPG